MKQKHFSLIIEVNIISTNHRNHIKSFNQKRIVPIECNILNKIRDLLINILNN